MAEKRKPFNQADLLNNCKRQRSTSGDESNEVESRKPGTISKIVLKNFMCHSYLEVTLGSNLNYIIGNNGSGKSAILTALVVGLGGKASLTNRGTSIKAFIKTGEKSATVEVTLWNSGTFGYQPEVYGDKITIIRHFSISSMSYKIKSSSGCIVSTKGKDVHSICNYLNIQVDNPVCILNQDVSRNFLNTKDAHQKFLLFLRATRLEELFEEYRKIGQNKQNVIRALKEKENLCNKLKSEHNEIIKKVEKSKSIASMNKEATVLQKEILWAIFQDSEEDLRTKVEMIERLREENTSHENQLNENNQKSATSNQTLQGLQQQIYELTESIEQQNELQNSLVSSLETLKQTLTEKISEKSEILRDIAFKNVNCNILKSEINNFENNENFIQMEQEKMQRLQEIGKMVETLMGIENLLNTSNNEQLQIYNSVNQLHKEEHSLSMEEKQIDTQIEMTNERLQSLQGTSNSLSIYGNDIPRIIDSINAVKEQFYQLPRGPLGSYIKLRDPIWAVAIEQLLGPHLLKAFTVDNEQDNELLMKIFQNVCGNRRKPMVITSKFFFQVHNVQKHLVQPVNDCISVYDVLEISDPVVANCIINQANIESVLLLPNYEIAIELMSDANQVPRNCIRGVTIDGDMYYPDPDYRMYSADYSEAQYLQVTPLEMISQLKHNLKDLADKKKSISNQSEAVKTELRQQTEKMKETELQIKKLERAHVLLNEKYKQSCCFNEPGPNNIEKLQHELSELNKVIEERQVVSEKIEKDIEQLRQTVDEKENNLENIKYILRGYKDRIDPLNQQVQELTLKQMEYDINKRFVTKRLRKSSIKLAEAQGLESVARTKLEERQREASAVGERPDNTRKVSIIMKELKTLQCAIKQLESNVEPAKDLYEKLEESNRMYKHATDLIKVMSEIVKELQEASDKRLRYYQHTEDYFVTILKYSFKKVLEFRQFQGNLDIDIKNKRVEMIVNPQQGSQGVTVTSHLSGGERSFTTVAFLYSLWQCMEFPFTCLDEFDVFMDKVNRAKIMEILLWHARSRPNLQFIFLTPQDISFMDDKDVVIHRLEDPKCCSIDMVKDDK